MTRPLPSNGAPARRFLAPLERFLHIEAASGLVLLAAAAAAMLWANSPWAAGYEHFWHAPLAVGLGGFVFSEPLHFWVNDGLMTIFFLVVGLEIRRELHEGALANAKLAALPLAAALGGILVPAALYLAFTRGHAQLDQGWAVPTATDIAFAVGVLALLGRRVPAALRVLLLALAIVDDIAAILVIAFFYVDGIGAGGLLIAAGGMVLILVFQRLGLRTAWPYVVPSAIVWFGVLRAGVHPAIAGVIAGLLTPVTNAFARENPLAAAARALEDFRERALHGTRDAGQLLPPLRALKDAQLDMLPPVVRVQAALHPWVAYGVMPLFALANAGVNLDGLSLSHAGSAALILGVGAGLVLGKPLGILAFTAVAVRVGLCALPEGVTWRGIGLIGCLGGIGFTMSIFIANLAFPDATLLTMAKFAVLIASAAAGILGLIAGRLLTPLPLNQPTAAAERSP